MAANPVLGVTKDNFVTLGQAFIGTNNDPGYVIALKPYPGTIFDEENPFKPNPRQWGAWMVYWAALPYKTTAMQARGYATTPSEWPSDFDAQASYLADQAAADAFEQQWRNERESRAFHAGGIIKAASKAVEAWKHERKAVQAAAGASWGEKRAWTPPTSEQLEASRDRIAAVMAASDAARRTDG